MQYVLVYMTAKDVDEAKKLGQAIVAKRLAACVNILPFMTSMYWWDGEVQQADEAVILAKTKRELAAALMDEVRRLHSYEVPCIVTLPITDGHPAFLDWIGAETAAP